MCYGLGSSTTKSSLLAIIWRLGINGNQLIVTFRPTLSASRSWAHIEVSETAMCNHWQFANGDFFFGVYVSCLIIICVLYLKTDRQCLLVIYIYILWIGWSRVASSAEPCKQGNHDIMTCGSTQFPVSHIMGDSHNLSIYSNLTSRDSLAMSSTSSRPQLSTQQMAELRDMFTQFRILVIGRANAGKTTILRNLCNATGEPVIFDPTGKKVKYMIQVHARYSHLCPWSQIEPSALDPSLQVNGSLVLAWVVLVSH